MTILVSPAEPARLRTLGETSAVPETYGADFLLVTPVGMVGCQRKEIRDLVASIRGDRIARELGQSSALARMILIVEGDWRWVDGQSLTVPGFLKAQYDGFCLSVQHHGWWVLTSESMADTARLIGQVASWYAKNNHDSLYQRPKSRGMWGTWRNEEWAVHLLQSWEGLGVGRARALRRRHPIPPLRWTLTAEQIAETPGIGIGTARKLVAALDTDATMTVEEKETR